MRAFEVIHPGIHTTIQDPGRTGFMKYGTPASGAADRFSSRVANWLVGNPGGAALLEITLFRLELLARNDLVIAITGGDLSPTVNGNPLRMWQAEFIKKGERVLFRARRQGLRAYLAVEGGFQGPLFLGSRSVFARGLMGDSLRAGDILEVENPTEKPGSLRSLPPEMIPSFPATDPLRVILGPQEDRFTRRGIETFLSSGYRVSPQSDRMGYRLEGPKIEHLKGADIISEPIPRGAIQVPGDGLPILLLWDAQVSGGYTKIATLISTDLDRLAQVMPGESLHFKAATLEEAHQILRKDKSYWESVRRAIGRQG
jgi:antagonist of KipI